MNPSERDPTRQMDDAQAVLDGAPGLLGLLDGDGRVIEANRAALDLLGCALAEVAGQHFAATAWFPDPRDAEAVREAILRCADGAPRSLLVRHPGRDGRQLDVELTLTPMLDATGRVRRIVPAGRDITGQREAERRGRATARTLDNLLSATADAIVTIDGEHRIRVFNRGAEAMFGYAAAEVLGERLEVLLPEAARASHGDHVASFGREATGSRFMSQRRPVAGRRRDGHAFPAEATITRQDVDGETFYTAVVRDLTERHRAEQELERNRQYTAAVLRCVAEGILGVDREGRGIFANPAALQMLGYREADILGRELHSLIHHSHRDGREYPPTRCPMWAAIRDGVAMRCDADVYWRADGTALDVEYTTTPLLHDGACDGAIVVFRDISDRRAAEARLRDLAEADELTGLLNRRGFQARAAGLLTRAREAGECVTVAMLDVDGFKPINDRFGHLAGDAALRDLADALRAAMAPGDVAARFGGDEFVVLLPAQRAAGPRAEAFHARLRQALDARNASASAAFPLRVSLGAAHSPDASAPLEGLLLEADEALYEAKRARRAVPATSAPA